MTGRLQRLIRHAAAMRASLIAFVLVAVLGLLSMGALGAALYYAVALVLPVRYPAFDTWHGDWIWPATIAIGMAWSLAFIIAGVVNGWLWRRAVTRWPRRLVYGLLLWSWAWLLWRLTLAAQFG